MGRDLARKRIKEAEYVARNKDKILAYQREWRAKNVEHRAAQARARYLAKGYEWREKQLREDFGMTLAEYNRMALAQGNVCAICVQPQRGKALAVDHDHATGKVRALLCQMCNRALGLFKDLPDRVRAAADYLDRHKGGK